MSENNRITLSDAENLELAELGKTIQRGLSCDLNGTGVPCRSDRFEVIKCMVRYLEIHDFKITITQE